MDRRLHIGGKVRTDSWEILDASPAPHVDHVGNANDLSCFADNTFVEIYASHVLEHLDYHSELQNSLQEWRRVLAPGGKTCISVPDMDILARLFLDRERFSPPERFAIMRMIFGGHVDKYDYHLVGLNEEFLTEFLTVAGYVNIRRTPAFGLFSDTSSFAINGDPISLNMIAEKPQ